VSRASSVSHRGVTHVRRLRFHMTDHRSAAALGARRELAGVAIVVPGDARLSVAVRQ
jgi:hypothetical protein